MMLSEKTAVIYGAGGSLGNAVAKAMAIAGAKMFLTGRQLSSVMNTAAEIHQSGGYAETGVVDAFDEKAINEHLAKVVDEAGKVDICFNLAGIDVIQDIPLVDLTAEQFTDPITQTMKTQFLTAKAAGQVMIRQGYGVILSLTATPGGIGYPYTGGFAPSCAALESFSRNLAAELGVYGVRVINIRSGGSPDSAIFKSAAEQYPELMKTALEGMEKDTMLKRLPVMSDIANTAVFLASDLAAGITGTTVDVTCGTTGGLNYRAGRGSRK